MSDWCVFRDYTHAELILAIRFGIYSVDHAINAGVDLEMPGTNKWRTLNLMNRS